FAVLRAAVFRAGAFFAAARFAVFFAPVFLLAAVLRALVFLGPALFFLLFLRFFPLFFVAMACAPICSNSPLDRRNGRVPVRITLHPGSRLAVPRGESIAIFIIR